ncbi:MAG TPA: hemolysin family protein [Kiritimatiellia bacterium]|nr:hemolysin family protein [Kiritimatiellia bacterium]HNS81694.1 hemolysin family protein [Kiritimatiellia bacterium]HPA78409.1 hemolysin family protein [Kiritimatiellia bacterium]HQQ04667.1 hemolysin family protein [Kiritimatiellia bacterium]
MLLLVLQLLLLIALLICSAFFSSSEVAFFSLNPLQISRLEARDPSAAARIREILVRPTKLLSTILTGNTLVNIVASAVGYSIVGRFGGAWAAVITIPLMTVLLLIFGEIGPKRLAIQRPVRLAVLYTPILNVVIRISRPLRHMLEAITRSLAWLFHPRGHLLSGEEVASVMEVSHQKGLLDADERAMLSGIMRLEKLRASDVMTPRMDIVGIDLDDLPDDPVAVARSAKVPYLPVYREIPDHIEGILDVGAFLMDPDHQIERACVAPFYVPEAAPLNKLLGQFRREKRRLAVVVDEYGGTAGLISRGDIIEEITGHIDGAEPYVIETLAPGKWLVDGQISLAELNQKLGLRLSEEGVDRFSGWIISKAGRLPRFGEAVLADGLRATVRKMRRHRIELVMLEKLAGEERA